MAAHLPAGYRQAAAQPEASSAPPVVVCGACGVGAPLQGTQCEGCKATLAETRRHVPVSGSLVWCAVRATFQCRSCAFHSPLDGIELDQGVHCAQCGAFQKFQVNAWGAAGMRAGEMTGPVGPDGFVLPFAHAVADLAGPTPEGRFPSARIWIGDTNPHRELGVNRTFATRPDDGDHDDGGGGVLPEVEVGRGHPVCRACKQPLDVAFSSAKAETRCRGCGATASYQVPALVAQWAPALRAVIAAEHRTDQRSVRLQQQAGGGVVALLCPQCGAPLRDVRAGSVRCSHCGTSAHVPARARPREEGGLIEAEAFFIAFDGPSAARAQLEQPRLPTAGSDTAAKAKGLFVRGIAPLPGIALPEKKSGIDFRQLGLTLGLAGVALAIGFVLVALWNNLVVG